tara:strand:- start:1316 stop:2131 length:816 start_codon:yes stop_codon:yes gene_type:complete
VSTPIGNLNDLSLRAKDILEKVDFIICENPKHSLKLLNKFGIKKKLFSLHDYNEDNLIKKIKKYQYNSRIALISDAGSPLISDPGYNLVKNFIDKDIFITSVPGSNSIIPSLQLSGLAINTFIFFGFVPKNKKNADLLIEKALALNMTSIFLISGKKIEEALSSIRNLSKNRDIVLCKELTKINENIYRGKVDQIIQNITNKIINLKGEFTLIVGGEKHKPKENLPNKDLNIQISKLLKKYSLTETVQIVHKLSNISKKQIYNLALKNKNE